MALETKYKVTYKRITGSYPWSYTKQTRYYGNIKLLGEFLQLNVGGIKDINIEAIGVLE